MNESFGVQMMSPDVTIYIILPHLRKKIKTYIRGAEFSLTLRREWGSGAQTHSCLLCMLVLFSL